MIIVNGIAAQRYNFCSNFRCCYSFFRLSQFFIHKGLFFFRFLKQNTALFVLCLRLANGKVYCRNRWAILQTPSSLFYEKTVLQSVFLGFRRLTKQSLLTLILK
jgi:hypothetical protein